MATVPPELPAALHTAYIRSIAGDEHLQPTWAFLTPGHRTHWEAVAKTATEFISGERVGDAKL